ncbi:beta strand repeat-containing protein [Jatrophihabitans sp.]|uniref:beta strand repeat-containing protein n=1 Tax=Jatrophihabitans sp. TaxID=1932789 RepID=UPI002C98F9FA|nr:putative Ig domain-containing protein [Jatrophihabitans sp.]
MLQIRSSLPRLLPRAGLVVALALAGQVVFLPSVSAATLTVTSTADVATNFGACGNPAQTTSSGSLREAVCAANNAGATSSTITVAAGTYTLTNGELQMGKVSGSNITLTGAGSASTIISGNNASRVFDLDPSVIGGVTTSISGVTITNGAVTTFGGAGIIAGSGNATTRDVLTLSNSVISNNHVNSATTNKYGGGVEFQGGSLTVTNTTFTGNTSGSSSGSALEYQHFDVAANEQLTVSGSTFSGNSANASVANINVGGALHVSGVSGTTPMSVTNSVFTGNTVVGSGTGIPQGGAIFSEGGALTVTESTFTSNSVAGGSNPQGGAVSVLGGTTTLHYNRITGNTGATGSGVSLGVASGATLNATDNWWGCNTGPGTAGCDSAAGSPTVSPRLVLTATASPATVVGPNATSTITATLTQNSLGSAIGAANLDAFAGLPIGFSDPLPSGATLGAASVNLASGSASTSYNSQNTSGPGHVLATLDNGTATATVTVNRPPAITSTNTVTFTVGTAANFTVTTSGYPAPAITKTGTTPPGMTFTDNGNGTASLAGTPTAGGLYSLSLTANNGVNPTAIQTLSITVNQPAAFTSANSTTFTVGTPGSFTVTTTPTAYPTPAITKTGTLPSGLTFTDNGNGTATLAGTPAAGTGGVYSLSLTASNGVNPNGTQTLTVTVNQAPAVTTNPSSQTVNNGNSVSFIAAASGFPAPTVQWQRSTDGGANFSNIAGATSTTYTFTAASADNGNKYRAVFTNSTGSATSTAATLTVNTAPTISSSNTTSFTVGSAGTFTVTTTGFPNATLTTTGTLPAWLSFTDNGNGTATLAGTPPAGSGGQYNFTINADNGTAPADSQAFTLTVNESPTITSADHTTFQVGSAGNFLVTTAAGFPVATALSKTGSLPSGVTFTDNGNGTATLAGTPAAGTAGSYPITITANNGASTPATQSFTLTVTASPVFTSADHATFVAGNAGSFTVTTSGGAGPVTITETGTLPSGVTFTDNGDGTATLAGTPAAGTGGSYALTFTASDGITPDGTQLFTLTVNQPPVITSADHATFTTGVADSFTVTTAPGVPAATTITKTGSLPAGVTFTDNGDGTATLAGTPTTGGSFPITITASNGVAPDSTQSFTLTVNSAPSITSADHTTFAVGSAGSFTVTTNPGVPAATTLTETGSLPSGVSFTDNGDGTATLAGTPATGTGGSYALSIKAQNSTGFTTQSFTLTVNEKASFTSADHTTFVVGTAGSFTVTTVAGFPVATTITETGSLPSGVSFTDNGDGTATLAGTPAAGTAGSYPLTISATNAAGTRQQSFTLTVQPANASPVITSADHTTFAKGSAGSFTVTTTAGFPTATTITETGSLPAGVTFTDNGDGTATLAGTPTASGAFPITITASNGATTDATQSFMLTVTELPTITSADHASFILGTAGSFTVTTTAGYPVATTITKTGSLPSGVSFTDNGDGTATLAGTPAAGTAGSYPLTISATNSAGTRQQSFTLTVTEAPTITSADHTTFTSGSAGSFTVTTSPAAATITKTGTLPAGVTFTDNGNGTATLAGTPAAGTGGTYTLSLSATNPSGTGTQSFTLTVNELANFTSANHATFIIGTGNSFTVTTVAGFPTATTITETGSLPSGVSFTDNGDGTATLSGNPASGTSGSYPLTLSATNTTGTRQQSFTLTVQPPNSSPVITSADHATFKKGVAGQTFTVTTTAGFPTATTITKTGTLPAGVTFTDNHNGTATIAGTPTATGVFTFTITASNGASTDATQIFTLTVTAPPVITSTNTVTFTSHLAGSFTVTTTAGYPTATTITETGALPAGVTFTDNGNGTATIAGTPTQTTSSNYTLTIKASNGITPDASQTFTLKVTAVAAAPLPTKLPTKFDGALGGVPQKVNVNQVITVTGTGYKPGAPIEIGWYYSSSNNQMRLTVLAHGYADAAGKFSIPVTVANNTGSKTVVASGIGSNGKTRLLNASTVVNPPSGTSVVAPITGTSTGGGGMLANTGLSDQRISAASAGALALTGLALMLVGRRRRNDEE